METIRVNIYIRYHKSTERLFKLHKKQYWVLKWLVWRWLTKLTKTDENITRLVTRIISHKKKTVNQKSFTKLVKKYKSTHIWNRKPFLRDRKTSINPMQIMSNKNQGRLITDFKEIITESFWKFRRSRVDLPVETFFYGFDEKYNIQIEKWWN